MCIVIYVCVCVCYQLLQSTSSALEHGVEDDRGSSAAVCLTVDEPLEQHEHQGGQLLLRETLAHHLTQTKGHGQRVGAAKGLILVDFCSKTLPGSKTTSRYSMCLPWWGLSRSCTELSGRDFLGVLLGTRDCPRHRPYNLKRSLDKFKINERRGENRYLCSERSLWRYIYRVLNKHNHSLRQLFRTSTFVA